MSENHANDAKHCTAIRILEKRCFFFSLVAAQIRTSLQDNHNEVVSWKASLEILESTGIQDLYIGGTHWGFEEDGVI